MFAKFTVRRLLPPMLLVIGLISASAIAPAPTIAAPSRAELRAAEARLMELEKEFELIVERYNLVHERLDTLRARIAGAAAEVAAITKRMQTKERSAVEIATELYKGGRAQAIEAVLSSQSINDIDVGLVYLEHSEDAQTEVFESLAVEKGVLSRRIASLEEARAKASDEQARLDELRVEVESKIAEQEDEVTRLNDLIERAQRRAARQAAREARRSEQAAIDLTPVIRPAPAPNKAAGIAVDSALSQVGKPYQWGAAGPNSYDCSGLTMWAWAQAGVSLPHNSGSQYAATPRVDSSDWAPGDLLFFGSPIHHVGMYIGNGQMVEAPYTGAQVRVVSAHRSDYAGAGRPGV